MNLFTPRHDGQTRRGFRILAGIVAAFIMLVSFPLAIHEAWNGPWWTWLMVLACLYAGIGLAIGAKTGRWFNSPG